MAYSNITLTTQTGLSFITGEFIQLIHDSNNYMFGQIVSYNPTTGSLTFTPTRVVGSGTYSTWEVIASGAAGNDGTSGTSGINGTSGTSGATGTSGASGTSGTSGTDGTSGSSGIDGTSGTSGLTGTSGTSGVNGTSGVSGTSGTSGVNGASGSSGTAGTSGSSGVNGSSGTSGTSGVNGTSGITPNPNARTETTFTATAGQTTFTVSYTVGQVDVYYNGSKLAPAEFTATTGTDIVLATACQLNDIVDVIAYITGAGVGGGGTAGQVTYFSGSTTLASSSNLAWDGTNLTIGAPPSPLANLHVYNASAAASMLLQTNSLTDYGEIAVRNNSSTATSYFRQYSTAATGSDFGISRAGLALFFSNYATNFAIGTRNGGDLILGTADTERARLLASNGYFGIGTSSPSYLLDVNGTGRFSGQLSSTMGNNSLIFKSQSATTGYQYINIANTSGSLLLGTEGTAAGSLLTNGSAYATVLTSGTATNLEFGTNQVLRLKLDGSTGAATFTGALNGTSATFSSGVTAAGLNATIAKSGSGVESISLLNLRITGTGAIGDSENIRFLNPDGINIATISGILGGDNVAYGSLAFSIRNYNTDALTEAMRINNRGNVGIGTSSPNLTTTNRTVLDINGTSTSLIALSSGGTYKSYIFNDGTDITYYSTGSTYINSASSTIFKISGTVEAMRITSGGLVGIGTSSPDTLLHIAGTQGTLKVASNSTSSANAPYLSFFHAGNDEFKIVGGGYLAFLSSGTTERMRITSGGNVGIGTSSPNALLQVLGSSIIGSGTISNGTTFGGGNQINRLKVETGAYTCLEINGATSGGSIQFTYGSNLPNQVGGLIGYNYASGGDKGMYISNVLDGVLAFATNNTERMRITSGGNVGIGTSSPNKTLIVSASVAGSVTEIYNTRNNGSNDFVFVTSLGSNDNNTSNYHYIATTGGADKMYVYGNGNIVNINNSYGTLSDISLKENIVDATPKLDDILNLKVRNFNLIGEETKQIGFIAQEFEEVFPSMVDTDGKTGMKTIKTSVLIPMLVKAIQELKQEIDELKNK